MLYPLFLPSIWATMSKNCIVDEFIAVDENGQLTIWSVDELTVDDLTVDELTVDELTGYLPYVTFNKARSFKLPNRTSVSLSKGKH